MMRSVFLILLIGCTSTSTNGDDSTTPDASAVDGASSDGVDLDGGVDAPSDAGSYAPCPTCCDPIAQTGCDVGQACYYDEGTALTYCALAGTQPINGACVNDSNCAAGLDCTFPSQLGKCRKFCTSNADCPGTTGMTQCALGTLPAGNPYGVCF